MARITRAMAQLVLHIVEAALSVVLLGTCGHVAHELGPEVTQYFGGVGLGIFSGVCGMLAAAVYIAAHFLKADAGAHVERAKRALPGLVEVVVAGVWCIFCLGTGGALSSSGLATWGACGEPGGGRGGWWPAWRAWDWSGFWVGSGGLCAAWGLAIASAFLLFLAWGASSVLAGFDMRDGLGVMPLHKHADKAAADAKDAGAAAAAATTATGGPKEPAAAAADAAAADSV